MCISQIKDFSRRWNLHWKTIPLLLTSSVQMAVIGTLRLIYEKLAVTTLPILAGVDVTGLSSQPLLACLICRNLRICLRFPRCSLKWRARIRLKMVLAPLQKGIGFCFWLLQSFCRLSSFFWRNRIVLFLFGKEYALSVGALQIMAWGVIPYFGVTYYSLAFRGSSISKTSIDIFEQAFFFWRPC